MKRTQKVTVECCRECKGSGRVEKREHFSLYTEEEQIAAFGKLHATDDKLVGIPRNAERCTASAGSTIWEACKEAVGLAKEMRKLVAFEFNGKTVIARADSDPEFLGRAWWKDLYGETPEETNAKR